jgi:hypothetical protein
MKYQLNVWVSKTDRYSRICIAIPHTNPFIEDGTHEGAICTYESADVGRARLEKANIGEPKNREIRDAIQQALEKPNAVFPVSDVELTAAQLDAIGLHAFSLRII